MTFIPRFLAVVSLSVPVCSISVAGPQARSQGRPEVITFDAPGAGTASGQGTVPRSISPNGEVTGEFYDSHEAVHGDLAEHVEQSGHMVGERGQGRKQLDGHH